MIIDRVMVGYEHAVPLPVALKAGVVPTIVFKRNDGWHLAAPKDFEEAAFKLWEGEWESFARRPSNEFQPIKNYKGPK
jgi:hypothetical protein